MAVEGHLDYELDDKDSKVGKGVYSGQPIRNEILKQQPLQLE